ncbi:MAG: hypothetical protein P4L20_17725, partial [Acidimicrobiales bacterium]|nr:hypothetical protein [Acidimicrobiales bacterium]
MNTGREEPAALGHEGDTAPNTAQPAGSTPPGGADDEAGFVWRSLLRAVDMLAGVAGLQDDVEEPDLEVNYGLDAYSDTAAYRTWLHDM